MPRVCRWCKAALSYISKTCPQRVRIAKDFKAFIMVYDALVRMLQKKLCYVRAEPLWQCHWGGADSSIGASHKILSKSRKVATSLTIGSRKNG